MVYFLVEHSSISHYLLTATAKSMYSLFKAQLHFTPAFISTTGSIQEHNIMFMMLIKNTWILTY